MPEASHQGFRVDIVAVGQGFLSVLWFLPVIVIPPILHNHSFMYHRHYKL